MNRQVLLPTLKKHAYMILPESVGSYQMAGDHQVYREAGSLDNFSIHVVLAGTGFVEMNGKQYTLQKGDSFLYFPQQEQTYFSSSDDPWSVRWVHFYGSTLTHFLSEIGFGRFTLWRLPDLARLVKEHELLLQEAEENSFLRLSQLSTLTYSFLSCFTNHAVPRESKSNQEIDLRIQSLLPKMQERAPEPFDLEYWAAETGVSTYYFCRLFKRVTKMTPVTFVTLCRLQWSKQLLLEEKNLTVKEIAERSGYLNPSYFNKLFLENEGMTPTKYRQMYV
ncbi:helix-turn-helix domain-containing protein [Gracilibacillus caseinilyticus]|uniref:Helix-turn-helix domain-containing protein n=1 Tax=Gracilibacillus caseinilyticus TaxID=2932256 RepID=A0ABY4EWF3_9BACI|nr:helix-turn-helix domain-containing protein [Gracilibacillus caseinilyticus]UOQ48729.1 helix-turn-helix domain-containing protein [Gracilibacillus caseinilyticus]